MMVPHRREFLVATATGVATLLLPDWARASDDAPRSDPARHLKLPWTAGFKWDNVVDITRCPGDDWHAKLAAAQQAVVAMGGGVVYFPPGTYTFRDSIRIRDGVVLRGADPGMVASAHSEHYDPPTRFEFPRYEPLLEGDGTPIDRAFKGIYLENPASGAYTGVVHISIQRGHIHLGEGEGHRCGGNRMVFGCVLRNAAVADPAVPYLADGQHAWQRFTARHHAAIDVKAAENLLVANNRLPRSGDDNFVMRGYVLRKVRDRVPVFDVTFDYDNRPGLYVNHHCVGGPGGSGNDGTPETHPHGFRKGIVIVDNYVYHTGRMAIGFCGDGVLCARNVTRLEKDVWRPTATGRDMTTGSSTNDNRAIEMRGWRWTVEDNDCEVHRNWAADRAYYINDGEGLMHEDHCNSTILDSRLLRNKVNSYLSIYKCGPIDGLLIEGNDVSVPGQIADIYVVANRNSGPHPCRNVRIINNVTRSNGILIAGSPASGNVVQGNVHRGARPGYLRNEAQARLEGNVNYELR
jgi:hypothetical protein